MTSGANAELRILIVEDNPADAELVVSELEHAGYGAWRLVHVERLANAVDHLARDGTDCVLLDLGLPDAQGLEALTELVAAAPRIPVVVLSGRADEHVALEAVRHGAQDYLLKGHADGEVLARSLRYAIERKHMELERVEFIARAAHELRTPLAVIAGMSEILGDRFHDLEPEQLSEMLTALRRQGRRAGALITKLLDLSQVEMGAVKFAHEPFDLAEAARSAIEANPPPASVRLEPHLDAPVPVETDRTRVEQIVSNLLVNAYKYGRGEVHIEVRNDNGTGVIAVSDNGPGIDPQLRRRLFEPFARGDDTATVEGSGLGLAICRRLAEGCGGRLVHDDDAPRGARFELHLPAATRGG